MNLLAVNIDALKKSLEIFWKGMVAILIVICVIMAVTYIMQAVSYKTKQKKDFSKQEQEKEK